MSKSPPDLQQNRFPSLDWSSGKTAESLDQLRAYAEAEASAAIAWYLKKRLWKRFLGRTLRVLAIVLTGAAGLVPVVSQLWQEDGRPLLAPGWSPFSLGLAGICILLDRFLGGTSSWLRYVSASQEIGDLLRAFRFDWEAWRVALAGQPPDPDQTQQGILICRKLVAEVDRVVREETDAWAMEFRSVLKQMDETAAKAARARELGRDQDRSHEPRVGGGGTTSTATEISGGLRDFHDRP